MNKQLLQQAFNNYCSAWLWSAQSDFMGLAEEIIGRMEDDELSAYNSNDDDKFYTALQQAMDDSMIYTADQWKMVELYCDPQNANFDSAWESLECDIIGVIREYLKLEELEKSGE